MHFFVSTYVYKTSLIVLSLLSSSSRTSWASEEGQLRRWLSRKGRERTDQRDAAQGRRGNRGRNGTGREGGGTVREREGEGWSPVGMLPWRLESGEVWAPQANRLIIYILSAERWFSLYARLWPLMTSWPCSQISTIRALLTGRIDVRSTECSEVRW